MKFSIIVPIYNVERYLEECLKSLINQSYKNIEIILVNDGSTDNSETICQEYKLKDKRVKYIKKKNGGLSSARNEGLKCATGEYYLFVDSDDYVSTKLCEILNEIITKEKADLVQYEFQKFLDGEKAIDKNNDKYLISNKFNSDNSYQNYLLSENIKREAWNKAYKKEIFKDIKFPEGRIAEDLATTYKIIKKANKIICINNELYFYRIRNNSIMGKGSMKLYYDAMLAHYEIYLDSIGRGKKFEKKAYSNYFNNLLKIYSKNEFEKENVYLKELKKRYYEIKYNQLNIKSKIIYLMSKINLIKTLKFVYKKYVN